MSLCFDCWQTITPVIVHQGMVLIIIMMPLHDITLYLSHRLRSNGNLLPSIKPFPREPPGKCWRLLLLLQHHRFHSATTLAWRLRLDLPCSMKFLAPLYWVQRGMMNKEIKGCTISFTFSVEWTLFLTQLWSMGNPLFLSRSALAQPCWILRNFSNIEHLVETTTLVTPKSSHSWKKWTPCQVKRKPHQNCKHSSQRRRLGVDARHCYWPPSHYAFFSSG